MSFYIAPASVPSQFCLGPSSSAEQSLNQLLSLHIERGKELTQPRAMSIACQGLQLASTEVTDRHCKGFQSRHITELWGALTHKGVRAHLSSLTKLLTSFSSLRFSCLKKHSPFCVFKAGGLTIYNEPKQGLVTASVLAPSYTLVCNLTKLWKSKLKVSTHCICFQEKAGGERGKTSFILLQGIVFPRQQF